MKKSVFASTLFALLLGGGVASAAAITEADIHAAQKIWGDGIVAIGKAYSQKGDYKALAARHVDTLYGYDEGTVLFKPTKAAAQQFRLKEDVGLID